MWFQADSDNVKATEVMLSGLKKRYETTGIPPVLIHTVSEFGVTFEFTA